MAIPHDHEDSGVTRVIACSPCCSRLYRESKFIKIWPLMLVFTTKEGFSWRHRRRHSFQGPVPYRDNRLPVQATAAGYSALIDAYGLAVPLPRTLYATGERHRIVEQDGWRILTPRHAPEPSLAGHLGFALKYEGGSRRPQTAVPGHRPRSDPGPGPGRSDRHLQPPHLVSLRMADRPYPGSGGRHGRTLCSCCRSQTAIHDGRRKFPAASREKQSSRHPRILPAGVSHGSSRPVYDTVPAATRPRLHSRRAA